MTGLYTVNARMNINKRNNKRRVGGRSDAEDRMPSLRPRPKVKLLLRAPEVVVIACRAE